MEGKVRFGQLIECRWDEWVEKDRLQPFRENFTLELSTRMHSADDISSTSVSTSASPNAQGNLAVNKTRKGSKHHSSAEAIANEKEGRKKRKKRHRREAMSEASLQKESQNESAVKVSLPESLWEILQNDCIEITQNKKIFDIPLKFTVAGILEMFLSEHKDESGIEEFVDGIGRYFDKALGLLLLYRFERQQYLDIYHDFTSKPPGEGAANDFKPSQFYGFAHLLRLLTKVSEYVPHQDSTAESLGKINEQLASFVSFLNSNRDSFFSRTDYATAPLFYRSLAKSQ